MKYRVNVINRDHTNPFFEIMDNRDYGKEDFDNVTQAMDWIVDQEEIDKRENWKYIYDIIKIEGGED